MLWLFFFFYKQKTAYEMRISDWSSDVCSSDLVEEGQTQTPDGPRHFRPQLPGDFQGDNQAGGIVAGALAELVPVDVGGKHNPFINAAGQIEKQKNGRASCRERVCQYV